MTESAWKSGCRRGSPTWPIRISVWTAPGRWTTQTRRVRDAARSSIVAAVDRSSPAQSPNSRSTIASTSSGSRSPATTIAPTRPGIERPVVRRRAARPASSVATVSAVPPAGRWYGEPARRSSRRTPRRRGGAGRPWPGAGRSAARRAAARPRTAGNVGRRTTSASSSSAGSSRLAGTSTPRHRVPAGLGVERRAEPLGGLDERDRVVDLGALGQRAGREDRGARRAPPARRPRRSRSTSDAETSSRPGIGVTISRRPFASDERAMNGNSYGRGSPGTGRSATSPVAGHAACLAVAAAPACGRYVRTTRLSGAEHVARRVADLLRRDRQVARQQRVDQLGVVEQRRVHREAVRPLLDPRQRAELVGLDQRLRAGQLVVAAAPRDASRSSSSWSAASTRRDVDARPDRRPAGTTDAPPTKPQREQGDVLGEPLLADEPAVEPAALAAREDLARRGRARRGAGRRTPGRGTRVDPRQRHPVLDGLADLARRASAAATCRGSGGIVGLAGIAAEVLLGPARGPAPRSQSPTTRSAPRCSARSRCGRTR